jgi:hypothetical protein
VSEGQKGQKGQEKQKRQKGQEGQEGQGKLAAGSWSLAAGAGGGELTASSQQLGRGGVRGKANRRPRCGCGQRSNDPPTGLPA